MSRYGMVIDLVKCIGCAGCQLACKAEHCLPPNVFWARVLVTESGTYPNSSKVVYPVLCFHCKEAPCERVCPSGATAQREDGIVTVDYDKCIGCRYCMMACPYGARYFSEGNWEYFPGQGLTPFEEQGYPQFQTGVVSKCTFCQERVDGGLARGQRPGIDREATPACVTNCMCQARFFGDLDDPESEVSQLIRSRRGINLRPEMGTEPSVYYLR